MVKRNRYRASRKKRAKIEVLKKKGIPIIVKNPIGNFHLRKGPRSIEQGHKTPIIGQELLSAIPVVDLTEDDPPSFPSLDLEFPSPFLFSYFD